MIGMVNTFSDYINRVALAAPPSETGARRLAGEPETHFDKHLAPFADIGAADDREILLKQWRRATTEAPHPTLRAVFSFSHHEQSRS